jgi:hypothetical protein
MSQICMNRIVSGFWRFWWSGDHVVILHASRQMHFESIQLFIPLLLILICFDFANYVLSALVLPLAMPYNKDITINFSSMHSWYDAGCVVTVFQSFSHDDLSNVVCIFLEDRGSHAKARAKERCLHGDR